MHNTSASTSMEFSIFYGNFSVKWKFLWNRDKCGNSMGNSPCWLINQYLPVVDLSFTATFRHAIEKWQNQKFMIA